MTQINPNYRNLSTGPTPETDQLSGQNGQTGGTDGDVQGAGGKTPPTTPRPALPTPSMSPTAMMIALTALNAKVLEQSIQFGEKSVDGVRKDIQDSADKRAEQLKKHFEQLDKVSSKKKCGFFGAIANFFKKLFTGDIKGAFQVLADNIGSILKDLGQLIAVVLAVVAAAVLTVGTAGAGTGVLVAAIVGASLVVAGMVMSDPGIIDLILECLPEDRRQAASIALAVVGAVLALAGGITMGFATGGASTLATVSTVATALSGLTSAGVTIQQGVDSYKQSEFKAGAQRTLADIDITDAKMTDLKALLDRNQKDLKVLFDAFADALSSTKEMILTYGQNLNRAASV